MPGRIERAQRAETVVEAVKAVWNAWRVPGPNPRYHAQQIDRLRREWPVMYNALTALVEAVDARRW